MLANGCHQIELNKLNAINLMNEKHTPPNLEVPNWDSQSNLESSDDKNGWPSVKPIAAR